MAKKDIDLENECKIAFLAMAKDVKQLSEVTEQVRDINYKLNHILEELREDYFYALGMRQFYDAYNRHMDNDYVKEG
ncbi:MAG: hypothetical protein ABIJ40_20890 [Bacteroidota bacterium]